MPFVLTDNDYVRVRDVVLIVEQIVRTRFDQLQEELGLLGQMREGKLSTALSVGGSATLDVYGYNGGSWGAISGRTVTVEWPSGVGVAIASGKYVRAVRINNVWRVATGEC